MSSPTHTQIVVNDGGTVHVHNYPPPEPPRPRRFGLMWPVVMLTSQHHEHLAEVLSPILG